MEYCSHCSKDGKSSPAKKFCINCEENLCFDCMEAHRKFKLFQNHSLAEIGMNFSFSSGKTCKLHPDYEMDFFCTRHDSVCCASCVSSDHRQCETVTPLKQASAGVKSSDLFRDTQEELKEMVNATNAVLEKSSYNMDQVDTESDKIGKAIREMKLKMAKKLDEAERELIDELSDKKSKLIQKIREDIKEAGNSKEVIEKYVQQLQLLTEHGSENQMFVFLHHIHGDLIKQSAKVDKYVLSLQERSLQFVESSPKRLEFGRIDETSKPCTVTYQKKKQVKAQLPLLNLVRPVKSFKFEKKFKTPRTNSIYVGVTGILTSSDHIIVCNQEQIVTYDHDGNQVSSIQLSGCSWDIARNGDNGDIVVTMRDRAVRLVDKTLTKIPELEGKRCWGIESVNGCVYLGGYQEVNVYDGNLKHVKSFKVGNGFIEYIHYTVGRLFLTDNNSVYCVKEDGIEIFTFSSPDLRFPRGITSDPCRNIYVVGRDSNNVHKLSVDGKTSEIVLSEKDGLRTPLAIAFSQDYKKIFLSNNEGDEVLVFDVEH